MTELQTQTQTTHNLQTDEQINVYLLLPTIYVPELVTLDCSFTLVLKASTLTLTQMEVGNEKYQLHYID